VGKQVTPSLLAAARHRLQPLAQVPDVDEIERGVAIKGEPLLEKIAHDLPGRRGGLVAAADGTGGTGDDHGQSPLRPSQCALLSMPFRVFIRGKNRCLERIIILVQFSRVTRLAASLVHQAAGTEMDHLAHPRRRCTTEKMLGAFDIDPPKFPAMSQAKAIDSSDMIDDIDPPAGFLDRGGIAEVTNRNFYFLAEKLPGLGAAPGQDPDIFSPVEKVPGQLTSNKSCRSSDENLCSHNAFY